MMTATLSVDGRHRYDLTRTADRTQPGTILFVMCNPSTADASLDDPTITKCTKIAVTQRFGVLAVVNLWSYRTPDPAHLIAAANDGIDITGGTVNREWIRRHLNRATIVVAAWGAIAAKVPGYIDAVQSLTDDANSLGIGALYCLGTTKDGHPKHPLARGKHRIADDQPLNRWHA